MTMRLGWRASALLVGAVGAREVRYDVGVPVALRLDGTDLAIRGCATRESLVIHTGHLSTLWDCSRVSPGLKVATYASPWADSTTAVVEMANEAGVVLQFLTHEQLWALLPMDNNEPTTTAVATVEEAALTQARTFELIPREGVVVDPSCEGERDPPPGLTHTDDAGLPGLCVPRDAYISEIYSVVLGGKKMVVYGWRHWHEKKNKTAHLTTAQQITSRGVHCLIAGNYETEEGQEAADADGLATPGAVSNDTPGAVSNDTPGAVSNDTPQSSDKGTMIVDVFSTDHNLACSLKTIRAKAAGKKWRPDLLV